MPLSQEQVDAFLPELTALTEKHKVYIWGCGCCNSPNLEHTDETDGIKYTCGSGSFGYLMWDKD